MSNAGSGSFVWLTLVTLMLAALLIGLVAWYLRRSMAGVSGDAAIRVLAAQSLGPRERVVVVQACGRVLLIGHTPQQISMLAEIDPAEAAGLIARQPSADFANRLSGVLRQRGR